MPTPTKGARLGGSPAHERHILANLATALFEHGAITTTHAKARRLRPYAERLITKAKRGDLHARRQVMQTVTDKSVVHVLFTEIGPRFASRPGGYTRITKIGPRKGDNAPMAVIELVEPLAEQVLSEAEGATRRASRDRATGSAAAPTGPAPAEPADEVDDEPAGGDPVGGEPVQDDADADDELAAESFSQELAPPVDGDDATAHHAGPAGPSADEAGAAADRAERAADEAEQADADAAGGDAAVGETGRPARGSDDA